MKFFSLLPWFRKEIPSLKALLIYGNHEGLRSFRQKYVQKLYQQQGINIIYATSAEDALDHYYSLPGLFDGSNSQKCIVLDGLTDSFVTKIQNLDSFYASPHFLLLSASKLSSRSKSVNFFQENSRLGTLPCYDMNREEISVTCQKILNDRHCQLSEESFEYLTDFLTYEIDKFFSLLEMIALYTGQKKIELEALKALLFSFHSSPLHKLNQYFFQGETKSLQDLIKSIEISEWISIIRLLIQDVRTLLAFHIHHLKSSDLKNSWSKGPVKFPYPRLSLYEKAYTQWPLERCGSTLKHLIKLEKDLKSSPSPSTCQISNLLYLLSSHGNIIQ